VPCAYILQEYCNGGTLEDYIFKGQPDRRDLPGQNSKRNLLRRKLQQASGQLNPPTRLSLEEITSFMTDVVSGVAHLHQSGVIHRDLKPSNCLLSLSDIEGERPCVLVSDFGEGQIEGNQRAGTGSTGTLEYCAPELLHIHDGQFSQFSKKTDMFSVGMILHFLCFSSLPYSDAWEAHGDLEALTNEVRAFPGFNFDRSNAKLARTDLPPQLLELLQNLLSLNPIERPSAEETLGVLAALSGGEGRPATEKVQEIRLVEEPSEASESDTRAGQPDPNLIMDRWYQSRESKQPPMYISYTKSLSLPRQRLFWIKAAFLALKVTSSVPLWTTQNSWFLLTYSLRYSRVFTTL
jgi:serine/threonine protein kinase